MFAREAIARWIGETLRSADQLVCCLRFGQTESRLEGISTRTPATHLKTARTG